MGSDCPERPQLRTGKPLSWDSPAWAPSGGPCGCPLCGAFPQILHDTLSKACLRISEDERLQMKALFGTAGGGDEPGPPASHALPALPPRARGLAGGGSAAGWVAWAIRVLWLLVSRSGLRTPHTFLLVSVSLPSVGQQG